MKREQKNVFALFAMTVLVGCATYDDPKDFQPTPGSTDTGRVCIYRMAPRTTPGAWQTWTIDGRESGTISPNYHPCMSTHVGQHSVRVDGGTENVQFVLAKDEQVFIRFDVDPSFSSSFVPVIVDCQIAKEELGTKGIDIDCPPAEQ